MKKYVLIVCVLAAGTPHLNAQWSVIDSVSQPHLSAIHFINADTGFTYLNNGYLRKTTNGGNSWDSIVFPFTGFVEEISFYDNLNGYIGGGAWFSFGTHYGNAILRTRDGGLSWDSVHGSYDYGIFNSIAPVGPDEIFICGNRGFFHSTDGGYTLDTIKLFAGTDGSEMYVKVQFTDALTGYVTALKYEGTDVNRILYNTTDGGANWQVLQHDTILVPHTDFVFTSDGKGAMCDYDAVVTLTTDYGNTWQTVALPDSQMYFLKLLSVGDQLYAHGAHRGDTTTGIYHSADWGLTWQEEITFSQQEDFITDFSIPNTKTGYFTTYSKVYKNNSLISLLPHEKLLVRFYPNPVGEYLVVEAAEEGAVFCSLTDMKGRRVLEQQMASADATLSLAHLPKGVYLLRLEQGGKSSVYKVVKE